MPADCTPRPPPRILPVLDLRGGIVVHAVAGRRTEYRPLRSRLVEGPRPLDVARALRQQTGHPGLYVADLDALQNPACSPDRATLRQLVDDGFQVSLDAGPRTPEDIRKLLSAGLSRILLPLEISAGPAELSVLAGACDPRRLLFSLDLRDGTPALPPGSAWAGRTAFDIASVAWDCGLRTMLVLDVAGVGTAGGVPTLPLCRSLRQSFPDLELWTGGGVRHAGDVTAAAQAGVDALLVATALHQRQLTLPLV